MKSPHPPVRAAAVAGGVTLVVAVLLLGRGPGFDGSWSEPALGGDLDTDLARAEGAVPGIRPGDEKGIVWAGSPGERTALSLVYLHGFSADRHEVEPLVTQLGQSLGANVFFTRLQGHGRDAAAMGEASVEGWIRDAGEAVAIGGRIGERIVLIGTSTGATLALWAAFQEEVAPRLAALVLLSPNLHPRDRSARLLLLPGGALLGRAVVGGRDRCFEPANQEQARHWTTCYPVRALVPMMELVERVRTTDPATLRVPLFLAYTREDAVVDPLETEAFLARLGPIQREVQRVTDPGDPDAHVLAGAILSPAGTVLLRPRIQGFIETIEKGEAGR